jgi:hypothetical protein
MNKLSNRTLLSSAAVMLCLAVMPATTRAQEQDKPPSVTANGDGSCTYHKRTTADIRVENGATYHQQELKGRKTGAVYVPDRTYLCKDGHFSVVKE